MIPQDLTRSSFVSALIFAFCSTSKVLASWKIPSRTCPISVGKASQYTLNVGPGLNSVLDLVSKAWYRIPFDQSELVHFENLADRLAESPTGSLTLS